MQDFKNGTKELDEIKDSLLRLKESFNPVPINNTVIIDSNEKTDDNIYVNMQDVTLGAKKKNNIFFIIQILFTLSLIHMDKFFFHIEGIIGLFILWYSIIQKNVNIPNLSLYRIAMLVLGFDAIFHTGFQELEVLIAGGLLTYQQLIPTSLIEYENEEQSFHSKQESIIIYGLFSLFIALISIF